jgi:ATP-dependent helicase/nuclease subunit B
LKQQRLPPSISEGLGSGATLIVASTQRQAALRAAWADEQRAAGHKLWNTPRVLTFNQFAEARLAQQWAAAHEPDRLLAPGAEWALLRAARRDAGGSGEARALHAAIRTLRDWRIPRARSALGGSLEGDLLLDALGALDAQARECDRKPLAEWLDRIDAAPGALLGSGIAAMPAAQRETLRRLDAQPLTRAAAPAAVAIATAQDDEHEIALIAQWCRARLEQDPDSRLLIVDAKLRQRRRQYERTLSQTLSPGEWTWSRARAFSTIFSIEGGQPLTDFPLIAHALLTLRLLTTSLRFDELLLWLRMPFLDQADLFAGAAVESLLRNGRRLEYSADSLAGYLERSSGEPSRSLAVRLRQGLATLGTERRSAPEWAPRLLAALRALGWPGSRALRTDEQQTATRWYSLLDEYSALGAWLPRGSAQDAVATLADLARERSFDPASVAAPVTLTDSHDDPLVHYDGIWVAGLDAAQWPPPPRPDVFIPLHLQVAAGIPAASAAGQSARARASLEAWRAATGTLICSWAQLDADAHRSPSPLLARVAAPAGYAGNAASALAERLRSSQLEVIEDVQGTPVNTALKVRGGVKPLTLQAECGFHAYGEVRLSAEALEEPAPGIDVRDRGMLLHKALELIWLKLQNRFRLEGTDEQVRKPTIHQAVEAAVVFVYRGFVPPELQPSVNREMMRVERLIETLLKLELTRPTFDVDRLEARREVDIAGGTFEVRIDRIDVLEGGGSAILDYKAGAPRTPRWDAAGIRDPQLLAYLLAERGRDVQALANVSLTHGRARFVGKASRPRLLPEVGGMPGLSPSKVPAAEIDSAWHGTLDGWLQSLQELAARYLAGEAPVQPAPDVCRNCHLTVLCRRVELAEANLGGEES